MNESRFRCDTAPKYNHRNRSKMQRRSKLILLIERSRKALLRRWPLSCYEKMSRSLSGKGGRELRELSTQREQSKQSNSMEQEHRETVGDDRRQAAE